MANIGKVLRDEVQRLTRKEIKNTVIELQKRITSLRKTVSEQRKLIDALQKRQNRIVKVTAAAVRETPAETDTSPAAQIRPTSKMVRNLRAKLGLTQVELAHLLGVSGQSVYQWERKDGPLRLRETTKKALLDIRGLGVREIRKRLEEE